MTVLNSSGPISIGGLTTGQSVELELGMSGNAQASLNDSPFRTLAVVPSGAISLNNFYGRSNATSLTLVTDQKELNLRTWALSQGWDGVSMATITIGPGIYIWSDNTAIPALTTGLFPGGLKLINSGYIIGKGGQGGYSGATQAGAAGGPAVAHGAHDNLHARRVYQYPQLCTVD